MSDENPYQPPDHTDPDSPDDFPLVNPRPHRSLACLFGAIMLLSIWPSIQRTGPAREVLSIVLIAAVLALAAMAILWQPDC